MIIKLNMYYLISSMKITVLFVFAQWTGIFVIFLNIEIVKFYWSVPMTGQCDMLKHELCLHLLQCVPSLLASLGHS